jgi:hypothetical protein
MLPIVISGALRCLFVSGPRTGATGAHARAFRARYEKCRNVPRAPEGFSGGKRAPSMTALARFKALFCWIGQITGCKNVDVKRGAEIVPLSKEALAAMAASEEASAQRLLSRPDFCASAREVAGNTLEKGCATGEAGKRELLEMHANFMMHLAFNAQAKAACANRTAEWSSAVHKALDAFVETFSKALGFKCCVPMVNSALLDAYKNSALAVAPKFDEKIAFGAATSIANQLAAEHYELGAKAFGLPSMAVIRENAAQAFNRFDALSRVADGQQAGIALVPSPLSGPWPSGSHMDVSHA